MDTDLFTAEIWLTGIIEVRAICVEEVEDQRRRFREHEPELAGRRVFCLH